MATTSLWHIEGSLNDLIKYVENPDKTIEVKDDPKDLSNLFRYVTRDDKTQDKQYVTAINCVKEIALKQMTMTKKQFNKTTGYIAWHGYQSFKPDEVTPEQCHAIGVQFAKEMDFLITTINQIYDKLDKMSYDELKAWYEENLTLPSYTTEIDGNLITVQSHFNSQANETILEKIVRLLGIKIEYI